MLMSIFSSFDALCAEFSYGQRLRLSVDGGNLKPKLEQKPSSSVDSSEKKRTAPDSSKAAPPTQPGGDKKQRRRFSPRFAPELDGVHCFESIVPY
ncbi:uncharacterized protein LOC129298266 [Prosopis cineraria]|uniref:uncharacterized protein LOC129298266 n=1 Tax=Prosopis cineraria TaxID=364024 RepID=UPI00240F2349|nr:uncharacterized protein LOC129298266 [Prosopis cineraria]